jgi:hypothetical protein
MSVMPHDGAKLFGPKHVGEASSIVYGGSGESVRRRKSTIGSSRTYSKEKARSADPVWNTPVTALSVKNSGSGHRPWGFFGVPPPAAVKAHVLKDHNAGLQIDRRLRSKTSLASLTTLYVA